MLRRHFLKASSLAVAAVGTPELARAALQAENRAGAMPQKSYPPLAGPFRLPQEWYKATTSRFQKQLSEKKLDGAIVTGSDNINYLTGAFATSTERRFGCMCRLRATLPSSIPVSTATSGTPGGCPTASGTSTSLITANTTKWSGRLDHGQTCLSGP